MLGKLNINLSFKLTSLRKCIWDQIRKYADEAMLPVHPIKSYLFDESIIPKESMVSKKEALEYYKNMTLIRRLETEASNMYKAKQIFGFCHLYVGTEAVGVGMIAALESKDDVITSYRCHGLVMLFRNADGKDGVSDVLNELGGKADGISKGKGGSMHMFVPPRFYGGNGIVGAQVPLGTGLAFAHWYKGDGGVSVAMYGDGASNQGQVFEAFNMAALYKIPVIFVCENNQYGMGTSAERSSASTDYYKAGRFIPGIKIDGMDVVTVKEAMKAACAHCRSGSGPIIVEMDTYRYFGHSMSDPGVSYRPREEVNEVRKTKDPINTFKTSILEKQLATEEELQEIFNNCKKRCAEARKKVVTASIPDISEIYTNVYVQPLQKPRKVIVEI